MLHFFKYFGSVIFALLQFFTFYAYSQKKIILFDDFKSKDINEFVFNPVVDKTIKASVYDIIKLDQKSFTNNTSKQDVNFGFHQRYGYSKFFINNQSKDRYFLICINQSRVDSVQLFVDKNKDSLEPKKPMGRHVKYLERVMPDRNFIYPIIIPNGQTYTYYLYSSRKYGNHAIGLKLRSKESLIKYNSRFDIGAGGMMFTLLFTSLLGLILFGFIRDRVYFIYSLYCFFTLLVLISDAGFVHTYFKNDDLQGIINISTTIAFYFVAALHVLFTLEILKSKTNDPIWFYNFGKIAMYLFAIFAILLMLPIPELLNSFLVELSYYIVFYMDIYIATAIVFGIKRKQESAYFYMVGFFCTLIFITILMLANLGILDQVNNHSDLFYFIPLFEIFIVLVGLCTQFGGVLKEQLTYQINLRKTQDEFIDLQLEEQKNTAIEITERIESSLNVLKDKFFAEFRINDANNTQKIIRNLKDVTENMFPVGLQDKSLVKSIEELTIEYNALSTIKFQFVSNKQTQAFDSIKQITIYKVCKELLNYIYKHSNSKEVNVELNFQKKYLQIVVIDDGLPFSLQKIDSSEDSIEIKSIFRRLNFIHSDLLSTRDKKGNVNKINIPYNENNLIFKHLYF